MNEMTASYTPNSEMPRSIAAPCRFWVEFFALPRQPACLQTILTSADRRRLKGKAQLLEPVLKVGHNGVSEAFLASVETELALHALIKIKFTDFKQEKHALAEQIATATGSALVQVVGHVAVFYRPKPA